jgi:hypothetical protein
MIIIIIIIKEASCQPMMLASSRRGLMSVGGQPDKEASAGRGSELPAKKASCQPREACSESEMPIASIRNLAPRVSEASRSPLEESAGQG